MPDPFLMVAMAVYEAMEARCMLGSEGQGHVTSSSSSHFSSCATLQMSSADMLNGNEGTSCGPRDANKPSGTLACHFTVLFMHGVG